MCRSLSNLLPRSSYDAYYIINREKYLEYSKNYYMNNKGKFREYYMENKEKIKSSRRSHYKKTKETKVLKFFMTIEERPTTIFF